MKRFCALRCSNTCSGTPYYSKEYSIYPGGVESAEIGITETDSRLRPYVATVKLERQRYTTRLHRERGEAEADADFIRETGTETLTYEWRGNDWMKVGSLFVAQLSEQQVDGQWAPIQETEKRTVATEEEAAEGGWFSRMASKLTGGD
jgi:hypothetical protein